MDSLSLQQKPSSSILVTGGTGLVGAYSAKKLADEGLDVVCLDSAPRQIDFIQDWNIPIIRGDVRELGDLIRIVRQYPVADVIHTAAVASESACRTNPVNSFEVNVKGTLNVAEVSRLKDLRLIYLSSQAVYGDLHWKDLTPIKEEEAPRTICGVYASHKMMGETIVKSYSQIYGLSTLILRPTWVYGPGQTTVQNPVSIILEKAIKKEPFILKEGGDHPLPYTYVKDLAQAVLLSIRTKNPKHSVFNVDGGRLVTVREVAEAVREVIPDAKIEVGPGYWPTISQQTPVRGPGDLTRARQDLGYESRYNIREGIREFAQHLLARERLSGNEV